MYTRIVYSTQDDKLELGYFPDIIPIENRFHDLI